MTAAPPDRLLGGVRSLVLALLLAAVGCAKAPPPAAPRASCKTPSSQGGAKAPAASGMSYR